MDLPAGAPLTREEAVRLVTDAGFTREAVRLNPSNGRSVKQTSDELGGSGNRMDLIDIPWWLALFTALAMASVVFADPGGH
ncbi:hypothetical protein JOF53_004649 [Crossiella equi]|uniref:Uncharacterized protein n=1 Tax=Crossiella equi TaxID=130796 RepID=A0ABS5AGU1_9PSEU|nr:hypothetical protein [Crossiella equi]MBP2475777.1 hypothetical protein [Crossiella equi]